MTQSDAPEIDRLERYKSRAWTRQMRAIRNFIEIKRAANLKGKFEKDVATNRASEMRLCTTVAISVQGSQYRLWVLQNEAKVSFSRRRPGPGVRLRKRHRRKS